MLTKRSFSLAGHRTSVALEPAFWEALAGVAAAEGIILSALVARVDGARAPETSLASALRVLALQRWGSGGGRDVTSDGGPVVSGGNTAPD